MNKDTTIEFSKEKDKPIGFSVVGGTDTPNVSVQSSNTILQNFNVFKEKNLH